MTKRISRHQMFMEMAEVAAKRGTCLRQNVGALLVHDNRPISVGYAGPPSGEPHCKEEGGCDLVKPCTRSIHAEENAIRHAQLRVPYNIMAESTLYSTLSPCQDCADIIIGSGVKNVYYRNRYRDDAGIHVLLRYSVQVYRILPNGAIINEGSGEVQ